MNDQVINQSIDLFTHRLPWVWLVHEAVALADRNHQHKVPVMDQLGSADAFQGGRGDELASQHQGKDAGQVPCPSDA